MSKYTLAKPSWSSKTEAYDWRAEAKSRVKELGDSLKDPKTTEKSFSDKVYATGREYRKNDMERKVEHLQRRSEEINDLVNLAEIEVGEEISISTSDNFVLSILRQARKATK